MSSMEETGPEVPTLIGTMAFCPHCGNLMDPPNRNSCTTCGACGYTYEVGNNNVRSVSKSQPSAFQSSLKSKRELVQRQSLAREEAATIKEKCPKCGAPEMCFHTMQLRSADEGQTVFYNCIKCGYKYSLNS